MVPLIDDNVYKILKIIPIPHRIDSSNEVMVVPVADYVAVNLKHDSFIPLTEWDLRSCLDRNPQLSLCHLRKPIHVIKDDQSFCETTLKERNCKTIVTVCKNRWVELNNYNKYFFFCCEPFLIKLVCNDSITPLQLTNSGLFSVDEGCTIKSSNFVAFSHRQKESRFDVLYNIVSPEISQINNIINITLPSVSVNYTSDFTRNHTEQLQDIQRNIEFMKNTEPLAEISNHGIHHYVAIYILIALVGLGGAVWLCSRFRCSSRQASWIPAPTPVPERGPEAVAATPATPALQSSVQVQCSEVHDVFVKEAPRFNVPEGYSNTSAV